MYYQTSHGRGLPSTRFQPTERLAENTAKLYVRESALRDALTLYSTVPRCPLPNSNAANWMITCEEVIDQCK